MGRSTTFFAAMKDTSMTSRNANDATAPYSLGGAVLRADWGGVNSFCVDAFPRGSGDFRSCGSRVAGVLVLFGGEEPGSKVTRKGRAYPTVYGMRRNRVRQAVPTSSRGKWVQQAVYITMRGV